MTTQRTMSAADREASAETRRVSKVPTELVKSRAPDLSGHQRDAVTARVARMPVSCRLRYVTAMRGRSPKAAISAFCRMCVGWGPKRDVTDCTDPACPLYPYRPYQ